MKVVKLLDVVLENVFAALKDKSGLTIKKILASVFFEVCLGFILVRLF
jgi:hypothetical protein